MCCTYANVIINICSLICLFLNCYALNLTSDSLYVWTCNAKKKKRFTCNKPSSDYPRVVLVHIHQTLAFNHIYINILKH